MTKAKLQPLDVADHLKSEEDMRAYLDAVLADGDPLLIEAAKADVAKARGVKIVDPAPQPDVDTNSP
jgi:probable addiction module antidote protein